MKAIRKNVALLAAMGLMAGSGAVWATVTATDTFEATAEIVEAISVSCAVGSLDFGTISRTASYTTGTEKIEIAAASEFAVTAGANLATNAASGVTCTITNESGGNASAALSATGATWSSNTLSGVALEDSSNNTLSADVILSKVTGIGNEAIYIGGALTVKKADDAPLGTYSSGDITLTVTE